MTTLKETFGMLKQTMSEFIEDDSLTSAAALAYYTVFSLPPLLVIIVIVAGLALDPQQIQTQIESQAGTAIGPEAQSQIQTMIQSASQQVQGGFSLGLILSIGALLFGATGAFSQLQSSLNTAWDVQPDPEKGGVWRYAVKRVLSLGMIGLIAALLLASVVLSSLISALRGQISQALATVGLGWLSGEFLWVLNLLISLLIISQLFAAMFKVLPDAKIAWRDVEVGASVTALLFVIGTFLISFYIGQSNPGAAYGAAAALAILLVWIYYSALILLLGAEFTQVWARRHGAGVRPDADAIRTPDAPELARQQQ